LMRSPLARDRRQPPGVDVPATMFARGRANGHLRHPMCPEPPRLCGRDRRLPHKLREQARAYSFADHGLWLVVTPTLSVQSARCARRCRRGCRDHCRGRRKRPIACSPLKASRETKPQRTAGTSHTNRRKRCGSGEQEIATPHRRVLLISVEEWAVSQYLGRANPLPCLFGFIQEAEDFPFCPIVQLNNKHVVQCGRSAGVRVPREETRFRDRLWSLTVRHVYCRAPVQLSVFMAVVGVANDRQDRLPPPEVVAKSAHLFLQLAGAQLAAPASERPQRNDLGQYIHLRDRMNS
jgi:hypothetical protein